jgi:MoaA/NifB/PqqE/SkfB family radical SAM enzyme
MVDKIKISLDSPHADEHDKSRGIKGLFNHIITMLDFIQNTPGITGQLSTVVTKESIRSGKIWELVRLAEQHHATLGLTIPAKSGRWASRDDILLSDSDREILKVLVKNPVVVRDTEAGYLKARCPAGFEELYITCYGDIIPCPLLQLSFGNIRKEPLESIWQRITDFPEFRKSRNCCLIGEDKEFINRYVKPFQKYKHFPVDISRLDSTLFESR